MPRFRTLFSVVVVAVRIGAIFFHHCSAKVTFYDLLGIKEEEAAHVKEVKRRFRRLALTLHPDKVGPFSDSKEEERATAKFASLLKAYEVLSDPERAKVYRSHGSPDYRSAQKHEAPVNSGPTYHSGKFELNASFLKGAFRFSYDGGRNAKGENLNVNVNVPLAATWGLGGYNTSVAVSRRSTCPQCGGEGTLHPGETTECPLCGGVGAAWYLFSHSHDTEAFSQGVKTKCHICRGVGRILKGSCPSCSGEGVNLQSESIEITIPPGATDEFTTSLKGKGHKSRQGPPGDLFVSVSVIPDPGVGRREGDDLVIQKSITLADALRGSNNLITLPDGQHLWVYHGPMTSAGYDNRVQGLGFVALELRDDGRSRGDLIVEFSVSFPEHLSSEDMQLLGQVLDDQEVQRLVALMDRHGDAKKDSGMHEDCSNVCCTSLFDPQEQDYICSS